MKTQNKKAHLGLIMATYLLGIFMGAIDTGILSPARTVIQNDFSVGDKTGIWMITIYTLAYAASIPIMGKLADKFGRKYVYLTSILLFGTGSLFCGLSESFGGFQLLLIARAVQAIGGGGILPVATAEFGTTFPKEKRGMALGLVGGVYGIANIFGASAGSAILDLFGTKNWQFIFYINIPITLFILVAGFVCLKNNKATIVKRIDIGGISILTVLVLSLLYGLKNIDFFAFGTSFTNTNVYPFLILFIVLLPIFLFAEKKAEDPVINLSYFKNLKIVITLILSFITGIVIMGMIFVPQFSENSLKIVSGSGGYFVIILGLFAGIGAPVSGKLIDKFGVKIILGFGFLASVTGSLFLILVTANYPNMVTVVISLMIIGVGIGFTMGTPLNYMMLDNTKKEESNSALATVSLIRSIGTAIAPAIMIGFIAHAGIAVQANVMDLLPKTISIPPLPYAQELTNEFTKLKSDPRMKDKFANLDIPDLTKMQKVEISMGSNSGFKMPKDLLALMKSSDVTNITANTKTLAERMFAVMTPKIISKIEKGIDSGITGMISGLKDMDKSIADMQKGYVGIGKGIAGMTAGVTAQKNALKQLENAKVYMNSIPGFSSQTSTGTSFSIVSMMPQSVKDKIPQSALDELATVKSSADLNKKIDGLKTAINQMESAAVYMKYIPDFVSKLLSRTSFSIVTLMPKSVKDQMPQSALDELATVKTAADLNEKISGMKTALKQLESATAYMKNIPDGVTQMLNGKSINIVNLIPKAVKDQIPQTVLDELSKIKTSDDLNKKIAELKTAIITLSNKIESTKKSQAELLTGIKAVKAAKVEMNGTIAKMKTLRKAIPGAFVAGKNNYITQIDKSKTAIENEFQKTLNGGFKQVYLTVALASLAALFILALYRSKKDENAE